MFRINSVPGKAASKKGHASFPEDFSRLHSGEDFTAWKVRGDWEIETILSGTALKERLQIFKREIEHHV